MPSILKNILLFTLTAGQSSAQAHLLNNNDVAKVPKNLFLDGAGYGVSADATNVSITRGSNAGSTVKVECEGWHSYEDAEPLPNGIATSFFPMVIQGAGTGGGGGAGGITALSAGTTIGTGPTIVFQNGGNVTFGLNGQTLTASVQTAGGTATGVGISAGTQSADTGVVQFNNGNGVSFGMSNSSVVTASVAAGATATGNVGGFAAGTQTGTSGTLAFANSNGMSFGLSQSSQLTASFSREAVLAVNAAGSITAGTAVLSDGNNVSFGLNGSTITASASFPAETPFALSAGTQSVSTGTVSFANGSGVSFGMVGSNTITASVAAGATATGNFGALAAGTQTATSGTVALVNSNGLTFGMNGSTAITASVSREPSISIDGGGLISAGTVVFSNANNVTFGLNGSTVTASATFSPSGAGSISFWENGALPMTGFTISFSTSESGGPATHTGAGAGAFVSGNNVAFVQRFSIVSNIVVTRIDFLPGDHATITPLTHSLYPRIYTLSGSTASMAFSTSGTYTCNLSSQNPNAQSLAVGTWNLTPGEYMLGLGASNQSSHVLFGVPNNQNQSKPFFYDGVVSSLSAASFQRSAINNAAVSARPYFALAGTF